MAGVVSPFAFNAAVTAEFGREYNILSTGEVTDTRAVSIDLKNTHVDQSDSALLVEWLAGADTPPDAHVLANELARRGWSLPALFLVSTVYTSVAFMTTPIPRL